MESEPKKSRRVVGEEDGDGEDRISSLPDNLIHHIFSFIDAKFAVQSSILSNRCNNVWKTLPHLNFHSETFSRIDRFLRFVDKFISNRNHRSNIDTFKYYKHGVLSTPNKVLYMIEYAIYHNVKHLCIKTGSGSKNKTGFPITLFNKSESLEMLSIDSADVELCHRYRHDSWSIPTLTEFKISNCELPGCCSWFFPALTSLELTRVMFSEHNTVDFSDMVNLKRLTLSSCTASLDLEAFDIDAYQLEQLTISSHRYISDKEDIWSVRPCKFVLSTPKRCHFIFQGSYPIVIKSDGLECLDKVFIDCIEHYTASPLPRGITKMCLHFIDMFQEFSHARCLMLSSYTIKVLSKVPVFLRNQKSPFSNLMSLKLQKECTTSTIPRHVESYLLSNVQSATKSSTIDLEYKTVAVKVGSHMPLSALIDQLDQKGIADINATGAEEAREFRPGYQFWRLVTFKSNVKGKGVVPQAADIASVMCQSLEGGKIEKQGHIMYK